MNSITTSNLGIEESSLNRGTYFQSLLGEVAGKQLLSAEQIEKLQYSLLELMAKEVERYTNGESSSVPIEKAQDLLQSITYLIGAYLKTVPDMQTKLELLKKEPMSVLFYSGLDVVARIKKEAQERMQLLQKSDRGPDNIAYHDTLFQGLPEFFHDYNMEYGAHELPGCIDYPLLYPLEDYQGVELIAYYLQRLTIENNILRCYPMSSINRLLHSFDKDADQLLINILELVLINSLGCVLLSKPTEGISISISEMQELQVKLSGKDKESVRGILKDAILILSEENALEEESRSYLMTAWSELTERLWNNIANGTLEHFFILTDQKEEVLEELYEGIPMEDEKLRDLIARMNSLNTLEEKVSLIREEVRSIIDLILLIEECFYPEEYSNFFYLLGEEECNLLKKWILYEAGSISIEDYEPNGEWQRQLIGYTNE
ncbi:MAG: hypothetical protein K0R34_601 [Herbinix sp.]|nr:hypothetical protein [Herbinix sp.]